MHRRPALLLLAIVLVLPGCTTALLWNWAGEERVAGQLLGVIAGEHGDLVVYQFEPTERYRGGTVGVRIARGWRELPMETLVTTPVGDALALATPFVPVEDISLAPAAGARSLRLIDYRNTVGRQLLSFGSEESQYGFVELMNDRGEVVHEVYGYHGRRGQWVRLAAVNLGAFRTSSARVSAGIVLTPVTLVVDVAILTAIAWVFGSNGGGSLSGIDFYAGGGGAVFIRFSDGTRYWQSPTTPAGPWIR